MKSNRNVIKVQGARPTTTGLVALVATVAGLSACADPVPFAIKSCPCADSYVCCDSGVCAQDQASCSAATAALSESVRGMWTGYLENFGLSSDDSIKISLSVDPVGTLSGQLILGNETPPAPATDPNVPWPTRFTSSSEIPSYIPGFSYTTQNLRWEAQRLRFSIAKREPWQPWCAGQQSYEWASGTPDAFFACVPGQVSRDSEGSCIATDSINTTTCAATDTLDMCRCYTADFCIKILRQTPANCDTAPLCGYEVCACDANGCNAQDAVNQGYTFDIALRNGIGDGSTDLAPSAIRLSQVSH